MTSNQFAFYGREEESKKLEELYNSKKPELLVLYGRRRIGKTYLLSHFSSSINNRVIRYTAFEENIIKNLNYLSNEVYRYFNLPNSLPGFKNYYDLFDFILKQQVNEKIVIILDEYQFMSKADQSLDSILENFFDKAKETNKNIFLILCGSAISFMSELTENYKKPLYGRRTCLMELKPFDFKTARLFLNSYSILEQVKIYLLIGGVAQYLALFDNGNGYKNNIIKNCFDKTGYLFQEASVLLRTEFNEISSPSSILESIGNGCSKFNEIVQDSHMSPQLSAKLLNAFCKNLHITKKIVPIGEQDNSKKTIYKFDDNYFSFYYGFLSKKKDILESGLVDLNYFYDEYFTEQMQNTLLGHPFESLCMEALISLNKKLKLPFVGESYGTFWGNNPLTKEETDIDVVIKSKDKILLGECKFTNKRIKINEYNDLARDGNGCFANYKKYYYLFSKSGFEDNLCSIKDVNLFDLNEIINALCE
ncbi:MAG TPA: hypothetical protein DD377_03025 [Firmicutes bacterium]|mgnify:FL=1|nr:hypothetical protein [Bacillota bacterium]HBM70341.1 hypothetical protein [Bacillota bacterium]